MKFDIVSFVCASKEAEGRRLNHKMGKYLEIGWILMILKLEVDDYEDQSSPRMGA